MNDEVTLEKLRHMYLHQTLIIKAKGNPYISYCIIRVPGGWLYSSIGLETSTFVPNTQDN